jgi:proteasome lid subunit RPN8/RPN11
MSDAVEVSAARFRGRVVSAPVHVRPRPRSGEWAIHRTADGRTAFIAPDVLATAFAMLRRHGPDETAGLMFGRCFRDADGVYAVVTGAETPRPGEVVGNVATVEITAEGAEAMTTRYHEHDFVADVLGWWHTHPRYTAFFSGTDRDEQARWNLPVSVGLVVAGEPDAGEPYAVYLGPDAADAPVRRRGQAAPGLAAHDQPRDEETKASSEPPSRNGFVPRQRARSVERPTHNLSDRQAQDGGRAHSEARTRRHLPRRTVDHGTRGKHERGVRPRRLSLTQIQRRRLVAALVVIAAIAGLTWLAFGAGGHTTAAKPTTKHSAPSPFEGTFHDSPFRGPIAPTKP